MVAADWSAASASEMVCAPVEPSQTGGPSAASRSGRSAVAADWSVTSASPEVCALVGAPQPTETAQRRSRNVGQQRSLTVLRKSKMHASPLHALFTGAPTQNRAIVCHLMTRVPLRCRKSATGSRSFTRRQAHATRRGQSHGWLATTRLGYTRIRGGLFNLGVDGQPRFVEIWPPRSEPK
jgi:hypothetical protein